MSDNRDEEVSHTKRKQKENGGIYIIYSAKGQHQLPEKFEKETKFSKMIGQNHMVKWKEINLRKKQTKKVRKNKKNDKQAKKNQ